MKTWKQALALVLALVMALSLVALPSFAEGEESTGLPNGVSVVNPGGPTEGVTGMEMSKTLQLNADGKTGTLTLEAYATGQSQVVYSAKPVDIVLVLDVSGSMDDKVNGTKKIVALQNAVNSFIDTVADKCKDSEEKSNIAIVKFSGNKTDKVGNDTYREDGNIYNYSQTVKELTSVEQKDALKQAVNGLTARGATCADYGMELARDILLKDTSDNPKVVIMFTDGTPTAFNGFEKPVADAAISASHQIKANGATVYTVGIFGDLNGSQKVYDTRDHGLFSGYQEIKPASNVVYGYMNAVSSNDTTSTSLNLNNLDKTVHDKFMTASSAAELEKIFTQIGNETGGSDASLTETATMVDVISEYFQLPDNYQSSLKAYTVPFTGTDASGNRQWGANQTDYTTSINVEGSKVSIAGFNYSDNWVGFHTANGTQTARGSKMVLEIPIQVKDGTVDEVPTNDLNNSGILDGNGDMFAKFVSPVVKYAYFTVVPVISSVDENGKNQGNPGTEKKVRLLDSPTYNLVSEVPEGYLYGGTFNEETCTTVHDKVEGQNPMAIAPVENEIYYIWEVPDTYLRPFTFYVWQHVDGKKTVTKLYPLVGVDRTKYANVGFSVCWDIKYNKDNAVDIPSGCTELSASAQAGTAEVYQYLLATKSGVPVESWYLQNGKATNYMGDITTTETIIDEGCIGGFRLDAQQFENFKSDGITYRPYWITLDGVRVDSVRSRTLTFREGSETPIYSPNQTGKYSAGYTYVNTPVAQTLSFRTCMLADDSQPVVDERLTVTVVDGSNTTQVKVAPNGSVRDQVAYQAPAGKVFAGWFADQAYTTPADLDQVTEDTTIYAKYVSDSYLDLDYSRTGLFRLRGVTLISAVDNPANYQASGFIVGDQKVDVSYASRYRIFKTPANLFGAARDAKLMLADKSLSGAGTLEVTPYWVTLDGTEVHGVTHTLHYNTRTIWE
jgi:hypothetical protein